MCAWSPLATRLQEECEDLSVAVALARSWCLAGEYQESLQNKIMIIYTPKNLVLRAVLRLQSSAVDTYV